MADADKLAGSAPAKPAGNEKSTGDPKPDEGQPGAGAPKPDEVGATLKPGEEPKPATQVPEKYELKLPDESTLDPATIERTAATARELGLSQDAAQGVLNFAAKLADDHVDALLAAQQPGGADWEKRQTDWKAKIAADPDIGGSKLEASQNLAKRVLVTFFDPEVTKFLHETGYASHPGVVKALVQIGKAMSEDRLIQPPAGGAGKKAPADKFYEDTTKAQGATT
jgi:hypothetical protein